MIVVQM